MRIFVVVSVTAALVAGMLLACEDDASNNTNGTSSGSTSSSSSSSSSGSPPAGPATVPPAGAAGEFCTKTLGVVVDALVACCTADDKTTDDYRFTHGLASSLLPVCTRALDASIQKQRVLYRADRATACYSAYQTTYAPPGACANITQTFADPGYRVSRNVRRARQRRHTVQWQPRLRRRTNMCRVHGFVRRHLQSPARDRRGVRRRS